MVLTAHRGVTFFLFLKFLHFNGGGSTILINVSIVILCYVVSLPL